MDWQHKIRIGIGIVAVIMGLFVEDIKPSGWTTRLIWGSGQDARIPRWVAGPFYFLIGVILLYRGIYK
jgi:hypothetical protein